MINPLVSVIVPVYNVEKYLPKCLDALIHQTLKNIEIICVNDGSTDKSAEVVQKYMEKDNRIRYIYQKNQGRSVARNTGIETAKAPYLMFCDSDDWYDLEMCEKMYKAITENNVDFACCGVQMEYEIPNPQTKKSDQDYYRIKYKGVQTLRPDMWKKIDGSACNKIFKKSLLDKYNLYFPAGLIYEDACFFIQMLAISKNMYCLPEYLYHYRRHNDSIMVKTFKCENTKALDHIKILEVIYDFLKKNNLWNKWKKTFYYLFIGYYGFAYRYLPKKKKYLASKEAFSLIDKLDLTDEEKNQYKVFATTYNTKETKILGIKLLKTKILPEKTSVFVLGIQVYSRKIKKDKEIFSILYIPVFKRRYKYA